MAPHQSNSITETGELLSFLHDNTKDKLSGNDMDSLTATFKGNENSTGQFGADGISSFVNDITALLKAFTTSYGNSQQLIDNFISQMQIQYEIKVTVVQ